MTIAWSIVVSIVAPAQAADEEAVLARLAEVQAHRSLRLAQGAPKISEAEYRRAANGEIVTGLVSVDGVSARKVYGVGVLDVDIATLWAGINDEVQHPGYTVMGYSELLSGSPCEDGRRVLQFLPVPFVTDRWWITVLDANEALAERSGGKVRETAWTSSVDPAEVRTAKGKETIASGMPIAWTKGGWLLIALDEQRTLVEYYVWTDPGGSIPAGPASMFASGSVTDALDAMERYAKDGKSRCPKE